MSNLKVEPKKQFNAADENYRNRRNGPHLFNRSTGEGIQFGEGNAFTKPGESAGHNPEISPVAFVLPRSHELKMNLDRFLPDEGMMRVRIRAGRTTNEPDEYASLRLIFSAHTSNNANFSDVVSQQDLPVPAPAKNRNSSNSTYPWAKSSAIRFGNWKRHFPGGMNSCTYVMSPAPVAERNRCRS